jgi:hypothetical protein
MTGGVEDAERVDTALAAQNLLPEVVDLATQRSDGTNTSDDDASFHRRAKGFRVQGLGSEVNN